MPVFENARFITCEAEGEVFSKMAAGADGRREGTSAIYLRC